MPRKKVRLITGHDLAPVSLPLFSPDTDVEVLDIGAQANSNRLRRPVSSNDNSG